MRGLPKFFWKEDRSDYFFISLVFSFFCIFSMFCHQKCGGIELKKKICHIGQKDGCFCADSNS
jgi:hypothetical protein